MSEGRTMWLTASGAVVTWNRVPWSAFLKVTVGFGREARVAWDAAYIDRTPIPYVPPNIGGLARAAAGGAGKGAASGGAAAGAASGGAGEGSDPDVERITEGIHAMGTNMQREDTTARTAGGKKKGGGPRSPRRLSARNGSPKVRVLLLAARPRNRVPLLAARVVLLQAAQGELEGLDAAVPMPSPAPRKMLVTTTRIGKSPRSGVPAAAALRSARALSSAGDVTLRLSTPISKMTTCSRRRSVRTGTAPRARPRRTPPPRRSPRSLGAPACQPRGCDRYSAWCISAPKRA